MAADTGWTIRPAGQADLAAIWRHGAATWGVAQADRYADGLFAVFDLLAGFPDLARERPEFSPPVRIHPSGAHLIIYRPAGGGIELLRVLHAHQNLVAYLHDG